MALGKLNFGLEALVLAVIALACRVDRRPRDAVTFAAALFVVAAVGWFLTGQSLAGIWPYFRYGFEIIRGYPAIQGVDFAVAWNYWGALLLFAIPSALVWINARNASPRRGLGLAALWLVYAFASFKQGFVLADNAHMSLYGACMLIAIAVLPVPRVRRWMAIAGVGIAACLAFLVGVDYGPAVDTPNPLRKAQAAVSQVRDLVDGARRERIRERFVSQSRLFGPPPRLLAAVGDRPVAFWPFVEGALVYAYSLNWRPWPVLEPYHAYTPALDRLVADMLASRRAAPERILRGVRSMDGPISMEEARGAPPTYPPLSTQAIFCRYRELGRSEVWQLLARASNRCGPPRVVDTVSAPWGRSVNVPLPRRGSAMIVRIEGAEPAGAEILKAFLLRPDSQFLLLDDRAHRFSPSTAPGGIMVGATGVDYPAPFELAPRIRTVSVMRAGDQPDRTLRYTFLELPIDEGLTEPGSPRIP